VGPTNRVRPDLGFQRDGGHDGVCGYADDLVWHGCQEFALGFVHITLMLAHMLDFIFTFRNRVRLAMPSSSRCSGCERRGEDLRDRIRMYAWISIFLGAPLPHTCVAQVSGDPC
jgi:hypothetical protein